MTAAPVAPGRLGEPLDPAAAQTYLGELDSWVRERRADLDEIDAQAQASPDGARVTGDLTLALALWKAVTDRQRILLATWDSGRVGRTERERLATLIWGRLDSTFDPRGLAGPTAATSPSATVPAATTSLAVSLPEACRLTDALVQQLRTALALDPAAGAYALRLKAIRAQVDRLRDQAALEPGSSQAAVRGQVDEIAARAEDLSARASRGGDIGGLIGPLENEAARLERDLIVGGAQRRQARGQYRGAQQRRAELESLGATVRALAAEAIARVSPAPRQAVPDVTLLGPVPTDVAGLTAYRSRLVRVEEATNLARVTYAAALAARTDLLARLEAQSVRATALGLGGDADIVAAQHVAREVLERRPTPVDVARALVDTHDAWIQWRTGTQIGPGQREQEDSA